MTLLLKNKYFSFHAEYMHTYVYMCIYLYFAHIY